MFRLFLAFFHFFLDVLVSLKNRLKGTGFYFTFYFCITTSTFYALKSCYSNTFLTFYFFILKLFAVRGFCKFYFALFIGFEENGGC